MTYLSQRKAMSKTKTKIPKVQKAHKSAPAHGMMYIVMHDQGYKIVFGTLRDVEKFFEKNKERFNRGLSIAHWEVYEVFIGTQDIKEKMGELFPEMFI